MSSSSGLYAKLPAEAERPQPEFEQGEDDGGDGAAPSGRQSKAWSLSTIAYRRHSEARRAFEQKLSTHSLRQRGLLRHSSTPSSATSPGPEQGDDNHTMLRCPDSHDVPVSGDGVQRDFRQQASPEGDGMAPKVPSVEGDPTNGPAPQPLEKEHAQEEGIETEKDAPWSPFSRTLPSHATEITYSIAVPAAVGGRDKHISRAVTCCLGGSMRVWDLEHGAMEREFSFEEEFSFSENTIPGWVDVKVKKTKPVSCCVLFEGQDGRTKLLAFAGKRFAVFDLDSGKCEQATNEDEMGFFAPGFEDPARGCAGFGDGTEQRVLSWHEFGSLIVWKIKPWTKEEIQKLASLVAESSASNWAAKAIALGT
jgi:hypothetical protein